MYENSRLYATEGNGISDAIIKAEKNVEYHERIFLIKQNLYMIDESFSFTEFTFLHENKKINSLDSKKTNRHSGIPTKISKLCTYSTVSLL